MYFIDCLPAAERQLVAMPLRPPGKPAVSTASPAAASLVTETGSGRAQAAALVDWPAETDRWQMQQGC